jgi:excisionase family DNA binding protein
MMGDIKNMKKQMEELVEMFHNVFANHADEKIMSAAEVAEFIKVDISLVYAMCVDGRLPHQKRGRRYQFKKSSIINWMKDQDVQSPYSVDSLVEKYLMANKLRG